jgi:hypothetical protein
MGHHFHPFYILEIYISDICLTDIEPEGRHGAMLPPEVAPGLYPDGFLDIQGIIDMIDQFSRHVLISPFVPLVCFYVELQGDDHRIFLFKKIDVYCERVDYGCRSGGFLCDADRR